MPWYYYFSSHHKVCQDKNLQVTIRTRRSNLPICNYGQLNTYAARFVRAHFFSPKEIDREIGRSVAWISRKSPSYIEGAANATSKCQEAHHHNAHIISMNAPFLYFIFARTESSDIRYGFMDLMRLEPNWWKRINICATSAFLCALSVCMWSMFVVGIIYMHSSFELSVEEEHIHFLLLVSLLLFMSSTMYKIYDWSGESQTYTY